MASRTSDGSTHGLVAYFDPMHHVAAHPGSVGAVDDDASLLGVDHCVSLEEAGRAVVGVVEVQTILPDQPPLTALLHASVGNPAINLSESDAGIVTVTLDEALTELPVAVAWSRVISSQYMSSGGHVSSTCQRPSLRCICTCNSGISPFPFSQYSNHQNRSTAQSILDMCGYASAPYPGDTALW